MNIASQLKEIINVRPCCDEYYLLPNKKVTHDLK